MSLGSYWRLIFGMTPSHSVNTLFEESSFLKKNELKNYLYVVNRLKHRAPPRPHPAPRLRPPPLRRPPPLPRAPRPPATRSSSRTCWCARNSSRRPHWKLKKKVVYLWIIEANFFFIFFVQWLLILLIILAPELYFCPSKLYLCNISFLNVFNVN